MMMTAFGFTLLFIWGIGTVGLALNGVGRPPEKTARWARTSHAPLWPVLAAWAVGVNLYRQYRLRRLMAEAWKR